MGHTSPGKGGDDVLDDVMWTVLFVGILVGLWFVAYRMDPHWVSKDGERFIANAQLMDHHGHTLGGWKEYRFEVLSDGMIASRRRSRWFPKDARVWRVRARSDGTSPKKTIFLLAEADQSGDMIAVRMPTSSRAVPVLERLASAP
jgi:hypothetical protein